MKSTQEWSLHWIIVSYVDWLKLHRSCWSFGPRLRLCVWERVWSWLKSYVACFMIQSKLQKKLILLD